jgi:hypothetical protein
MLYVIIHIYICIQIYIYTAYHHISPISSVQIQQIFGLGQGKYPPAQTFVLGCGVAGLSAIGTSKAMGSVVRAWDVRDVSDQAPHRWHRWRFAPGIRKSWGCWGIEGYNPFILILTPLIINTAGNF